MVLLNDHFFEENVANAIGRGGDVDAAEHFFLQAHDAGRALDVVDAHAHLVRQFIVQGILLGAGFRVYGGRLDEEISHDGNTGAGAAGPTATATGLTWVKDRSPLQSQTFTPILP